MDTRNVMEKRRKAIDKGNKHWRRGTLNAPGDSRNISPNDWRDGMDTSHAPDFGALIPVNTAESFPVDARRLHGLLGVKRDFSTWIKSRIVECGFSAGQDYTSSAAFPENGEPTNGGFQRRVEYAIALEMAKHLAMLERNDMGRKVRAYFIECERRLLAHPQPILDPENLPTHLDTARALVLALEDRDRLQQELEQQRPAVEFAQAVTESVNSVDMATAAQRLKWGHYRLMARLRDMGILIAGGPRRNLPMQRYLDRGYFAVVTGTHERLGELHTHNTTRVTGKGLEWLHNILTAQVQERPAIN